MDRNLSALGSASAACIACLAVLIAHASIGRAGGDLVDPTRPTSTHAGAATEDGAVHVEAVIVRAGSRIAIVNGHVVHAGDRLGDILIEEVTAAGVRYMRHGHSAFARLAIATVAVRRAPVSGEVP